MALYYNQIERAVLGGICFFDIFKYPLNNIECWRLSYSDDGRAEKFSLVDTDQALLSLHDKGVIKNNLGFWQLASSPDYYKIRQERYRIAAAKYRRLKPWIKIFGLLPSVRLVSVVNSLGYRNPELSDDIDFFIVTKRSKVWLTRLYLTGLAKLLGLRPTINHQQDGLCLSFYIGDDHLNLSDLRLGDSDVYFNFWFKQMTVLFNDGVYKELIAANSAINGHFPNSFINTQTSSLTVAVKLIRLVLTPFIISPVEVCARWWQRLALPQLLRELSNKDTRVVISNSVLKFHDQDRRSYYYDLWQEKLMQLGTK